MNVVLTRLRLGLLGCIGALFPVACSTSPESGEGSPDAEGETVALADAPYRGVAAADGWWQVLGGGTLNGWKPVGSAPGATLGEGQNTVVLPATDGLNAIRWEGVLPIVPYEIVLEANRLEGDDIFCGLTFPVGGSAISLILGGWSGQICGLSSLDHFDAAENETTTFHEFENGKWYRIRLVVREDSITAWLDDERLVDVNTQGRVLDTRFEMDGCKPFGLATWLTRGGFRDLRVRHLGGEGGARRGASGGGL